MGTRSYAHSDNLGTVGSLVPTMSGRGVGRHVYQYDYDQDEVDSFVDDLCSADDDIIDDIHAKIDTKTLGLGAPDPRGSKQYYVGGNSVLEYAGKHRNYARKGISPYKQPKHSGPPMGTGGANQAFRTTGTSGLISMIKDRSIDCIGKSE